MATNYKLKDISKLLGRSIFVDANVLIYLFWPTGDFDYENKYASVIHKLLKQGNNLCVDFLVISEVVNRVARIENNKINPDLKYKAFRDTPMGKEALNDIYIILKDNVLKRFNIVGKTFDKHEIEGFLCLEKLDFVDKATVSVCKENNFVLLTNDTDFKDCGLDILTNHPNILN